MGTVIKTLTITTDDSGLQTLVDQANAEISALNDLGTQAQTHVANIQSILSQIAVFSPAATVSVTDPAPAPEPDPNAAPTA